MRVLRGPKSVTPWATGVINLMAEGLSVCVYGPRMRARGAGGRHLMVELSNVLSGFEFRMAGLGFGFKCVCVRASDESFQGPGVQGACTSW